MLSLCRQTDRRMDGWITVKQYAPYLSMRGHNKCEGKLKLVRGRVENIVGKGDNDG